MIAGLIESTIMDGKASREEGFRIGKIIEQETPSSPELSMGGYGPQELVLYHYIVVTLTLWRYVVKHAMLGEFASP